jgi:hypothetical protein
MSNRKQKSNRLFDFVNPKLRKLGTGLGLRNWQLMREKQITKKGKHIDRYWQ